MGFGGSHLVADVLISTEAFVFHQKKSESREVDVWFEDAGPSSVGCGRRAENPLVRVVMLRFCCILERGSSSSSSASQPASENVKVSSSFGVLGLRSKQDGLWRDLELKFQPAS